MQSLNDSENDDGAISYPACKVGFAYDRTGVSLRAFVTFKTYTFRFVAVSRKTMQHG